MIDYKNLPKKRMAAMALIQNASGEILIVKPHYREGWLLPGGIIEENESPAQACIREVLEEVGMTIVPDKLLTIDYKKADGEKTEAIHFVFYGGNVTKDQVKLQKQELTEFRFVGLSDAQQLLIPPVAKRIDWVLKALKDDRTIYLDDLWQ